MAHAFVATAGGFVTMLMAPLTLSAQEGSTAAGTWGEPGCVRMEVDFYSGFPWNHPRHHEKPVSLLFWLETTLKRIYPNSPAEGYRSLSLVSARNAQLSFQAGLRNERAWPVDVQCEVTGADDMSIQVRRVGWALQTCLTGDVAPKHLDGVGYVPGLVPDPLFPETTAKVPAYSNQSFWITVRVPADAQPGRRELQVRFTSDALPEPVTLPAYLEIYPLVLQPRHDLPVTHWWNADAIYDWYEMQPFGDEWFRIARRYLQNMLDHGSNVIMVPIFYTRREIVARPPQLLGVTETAPGQYEFDWSRTRRFVEMAREIGFAHFEWPHFWSYKVDPTMASVETPTRIYTWEDGRARPLWPPETPATGRVYRGFLEQFLPEFHQFLTEEELLEISCFHLSDEPGSNPQDYANYRAARELLTELAPWMKVMDALSDLRYAQEPGLTDMAVPNVQVADVFIDAGLPHWVYYCTGPRGPYLNRFHDTPLPAIRMSGWLFYHLKPEGFLHWGYNYWYVMDLGFNQETQVLVDPFLDGAAPSGGAGAGSPYGDHFVVYPGPDGPLDSIRWEVFAESLQDYALLQTAGVDRDDPLFAAINGYGDFPRDPAWIRRALVRVLENTGEQ
jgi:hypothetical protein